MLGKVSKLYTENFKDVVNKNNHNTQPKNKKYQKSSRSKINNAINSFFYPAFNSIDRDL